MLRLRGGRTVSAKGPAPHTPVQQVCVSAWLSGPACVHSQARAQRQVQASAKKWQEGGQEDDDDDEPAQPKRGGKRGQQSKRSKGKSADAEEEEFVEDIGGGIGAAALQHQPEGRLQEATRQHAVAATDFRGRSETSKSAGQGEGRDRPPQRQGPKRIFAGPRQGLSYSALEQREQMGNMIRNAPDWRALAAFVEAKGSVMDAEQALTVLFKLSCCPVQERPGGGSRKLPPAELQALQQAFSRPQDAGESGVEYDRMLSTLLGWVLVLLPGFRPKQVIKCVTSLAYMKLYNADVAAGLKDLVVKHMINFEAAEYGIIAGSFAKLGYFPGPDFNALLMKKTVRKLAPASAEDLGRMAQGLAELGCIPTTEWAEAFWAATADKADGFAKAPTASKSMLVAVGYFAQAGLQPPQQWVDTVFGALVTSDGKDRGPKVPVINAMLYALTSLFCKPSQEWYAAVLDAWRKQLNFCVPSDLGTIPLYLGRYLGITIPQQLGSQLLAASLRSSRKMQADDLAAVTYLLGTSRLELSTKELDDLAYVLGLRLGGCSISGLEMLASALPYLGDTPRLRSLVDDVNARVSQVQQQQQQGGDVSQAQLELVGAAR